MVCLYNGEKLYQPRSTNMQIVLNGEIQQLRDNCSVQTVIEEMGLQDKRIAVEVNQEIIPRAKHDQHKLVEGDRIEIIHAVGGG